MTSIQLRLVSSILSEIYGDIVSKVGSTILREGRCTIGNVQRVSGLSLKKIRDSLVILMSHHLVTFAESEDKIVQRVTIHYNLEFDAVTTILRYPVFFQIARDIFGKEAALVVMTISKYGVTTPDIIAQESHLPMEIVLDTCGKLLLANYISFSDPRDFKTVLDQIIAQEDEDDDKVDIVSKMTTRKRKTTPNQQKSEKVKLVEQFQKLKRSKLTTKASEQDIPDVNIKSKLRLNVARFNIHLRGDSIKRYAKLFLNETGYHVMDQILKQVTENDNHCLTTRISSKISIANLLHGLPKNMKLQVDGLLSIGSSTNDRASALRLYLDAMNSSQVGFLIKADDVSMGGVYCVNYDSIIQHMRANLLENFILDTFGEKSMRLFRSLQRSEVMDDKGLSKISLVSPKEARERLFQLFQNGFIEMQEVPRSQDRAPGRTIFLWKKSSNVLSNFIHRLYKAQTNIRERRLHEKMQKKPLLEKLQRTDVAADESLLSNYEKKALYTYRERINRIIAYEMHLDSMVVLLRDF